MTADQLRASTAYFQTDLDQLRSQMLRGILAAVVAAAVLILAVFSDHRELVAWVVGLAGGLAGLAGLSWLVLRWNTRLAAAILIAGLLGLAAVVLVEMPDPRVLAYLPLIALCAVACFGLAAGLVTLGLLGAGLAWASGSVPLPLADITDTLAVTAGVVVLTWLAMRPTLIAVVWSWLGYAEATWARGELERQQGELTRAVHGLNVAQHRLEQLNQELAWAREAAEDARRLKSEFAANISHELRTPLNHIIGFSDVMVSAPEAYGGEILPPGYREDLEAVNRSARHLAQLIDDVLDLSQIEAERMGLAKAWASLPDIVDEAVAVVTRFLQSKRLFLRTELSPELPPVLVDRTRIRQVLINLLGNAARFTEQGGITVRAEVRDHDVVVSVIDTGPGIRPEDLSKVFEEFRQLDGSTRRRHEGSGLGLAISKRFVELHGGSIWAESALAQGSTFSFSLPIAETSVVTAPYSGERPVWERLAAEWTAGRKTLAVVSEDPAVAHLVRRFLDGYEVVAVASLAEATALGAAERVDAVLLTGPSTRECLAAVGAARDLPAAVPIVTCSLPTRRDRARELGVAQYLVKPVEREQVLAALDALGPQVRTLLLVDDDEDTLRLFTRIIHTAPRYYAVTTTTSGPEALRLLETGRPDAIILDLLMPEVSGYDVLAAIRRSPAAAGAAVIVVSARGEQEEAVVADAIAVTRPGGLPVGELTDLLRAALAQLLGPPAVDAGLPAGRLD
jgi:signal transduction histidine kinase/DNA-binding response OmpR family regulator